MVALPAEDLVRPSHFPGCEALEHHPVIVPVPGLDSWVSAARDCGFDLHAVAREAGWKLVSVESREDADADAELKLLELCVSQARTRHFPLALGEALVINQLRLIEAFVETSPSLRHSLQALPWVRALVLPRTMLTIEEGGQEAALVVSPDPEVAQKLAGAYLVEIVIAAVRKCVRGVLGEALGRLNRPLLAVQFQRPRPENAAQFHDFFPCAVKFNAPRNALVFDRALLDLPLMRSYPGANLEARQAIEHAMATTPSKFSCTEKVRQMLESDPALLKGGLDEVAAAMCLHGRTLQRRLHAEGFRFADLQGQAKYARARQLLARKAISMESISAELGFSDRRAFTFAFKRWAGMSPSSYRAQILQSAGTLPRG